MHAGEGDQSGAAVAQPLGQRLEQTGCEQHHEAADGSGWPKSLTDTSVGARILAMTNRYDRLCAPEAPGTAPLMPSEALALMLRQEASKYDAHMLSTLIKLLGVYPPGTVVKLNDGSLALVVCLVLRAVTRGSLQAGSRYLMWVMVPCAMVAAGLPRPAGVDAAEAAASPARVTADGQSLAMPALRGRGGLAAPDPDLASWQSHAEPAQAARRRPRLGSGAMHADHDPWQTGLAAVDVLAVSTQPAPRLTS